jgi:hypothetical protein
MNLNGSRKAKAICEKYLREHFSAYPIAYILGVIRLREGENDATFDCFLLALRIRPTICPPSWSSCTTWSHGALIP